jgi:ADP-heptose:LPS heptosyltransferase
MGWGDELMVTGQARLMQMRDPRKVRIEYERPRWFDTYEHNPRIALPTERGDFQILRPRANGLRPYCTNKTPERWTWKAYRPPVGELYLTPQELVFGAQFAGRVIVEPHIKAAASPNKQWGWMRWNKLAWMLMRRGVRLAQIGPGHVESLEGVEFIETPGLRHAAAVVANARAVVVPEGGLHHTAAVFNTPEVVIYGGFISPEVTGYAGQVSLFMNDERHPLGCGWRTLCDHCSKAMASITPEAVAIQLENLLANRDQRDQELARPVAA